MDIPVDLRYTKDHEWARQNPSSVTVGITTFAIEQLGDITLVELPSEGAEVTAGESFGTIESVKSVSELYAPISGRVVRVNQRLADEPELVNYAPYSDGWMIEIAPSGDELASLMDATAYTALVAEAH